MSYWFSLHQSLKVRKLQRGDSAWLEHYSNATYEIVEIRHLRKHVVADYEIGRLTVRNHLAGGVTAKELNQGWYAFLLRNLETFTAGSTPRTWMPLFTKYCNK